MAIKAYLTAEEHAALTDHLSSDAVKAIGLEFKQDGDGRFLPVVEPRDGFALENVTALKSSVASTRAERDALDKKIKAYGDVDPDTLSALVDKASQFDAFDPKAEAGKAKAQLEEWKGAYVKKTEGAHAEELRSVTERLKATESQLATNLIEVQARSIMADPEINANAELLMPHVRNRTDTVIGDDGKMKVIVVNPAKPGEPMVGKDGEDMGLKELIADELRSVEALKPAFGAPAASGAGQRPESTTSAISGKKKSDFTAEARSLFIRENGRDAWHKLPA